MRRLFDTLNRALATGLVAAAVWAWPRLPAQIPTHFGLDGQPDAWGAKTLGSWFLAPAMALLLVALIGWFRWMLPRRPGWVNLPDKTRLSELPEAARTPVVEMLSGFLSLVQVEILVIFCLIQLSTFRGALGQESQGIMILVLLIAILASPFLLVVFFLSLQKAMDRGKKLAAEEGGVSLP